jgi:hypothetical protein
MRLLQGEAHPDICRAIRDQHQLLHRLRRGERAVRQGLDASRTASCRPRLRCQSNEQRRSRRRSREKARIGSTIDATAAPATPQDFGMAA